MIRKHRGILYKMWISIIYIASMLILQLYIDKHKEKKGEGWKNSTLLSSTIFSFFLFMQKDDKEEFISAKHIRDICKLIGCSKTQENELWTQSHYCTYSKKKGWRKSYYVYFIIFWRKNAFSKRKHSLYGKRFQGNTFFLKTYFWKHFIFGILFQNYCYFLFIYTHISQN